MYSFHASAAAYTDYWNNTFGQVNLEYSTKLNCQDIWQAFVQESVRSIATDQNVYLELNENLPIDEVTREAFNALRQNGVIYAANGHAYLECTQPYRPSENENPDDMNVLYFTVPHLSPVDSSGLHRTPLDSAFKGRKYTAGLTPVQWTHLYSPLESSGLWTCNIYP